MTPDQLEHLNALRADMDEVVAQSAQFNWVDVKHRLAGVSYEDLVGWRDRLDAVIAGDGN